MSEFLGFIFIDLIFNFIGAIVRWVFGSFWRSIRNKPRFKFSDYLNGHRNPDYYEDQFQDYTNAVVGVVFTVLIILLIIAIQRSI